MKQMFDVILDKDEQILKVYKPNRRRYIYLQIVGLSFIIIPLLILLITLAILAFSGKIQMIDEGIDTTREFAITMLVLGILLFLAYGIAIVVKFVQYSKTFYAHSNKRILIRTGFIGVDFTVLEMKLIGTTSISVGLLDKFIKPNTGTIRFGSNATPISGGQNQMGGLMFRHIDDAYTTYREIKEVVDTHVR